MPRLLLPFLLLLPCLLPAAPALASPPATRLVGLEGMVEYRPGDARQWQAARLEQTLEPASVLRTGRLSWAALLFPDRTQIKVAASSMFRVRAAPGAGEPGPTVLELRRGKAWSQSKAPPGGVRMETPSAIAAIRGTDWMMEVDDRDVATLTVFSGTVRLENGHGAVDVGSGEEATAAPGQAPVKRSLVQPLDRMQWVATPSFDAGSLAGAAADPALAPALALLPGDPGAAMDAVQAIATGQRSPAAWLLGGWLLAAGGEHGQALGWLDGALARYPDDAALLALKGRVLLWSGRTGAALAFLEEARRRLGRDGELDGALGEAARRSGHYRQALDALHEALAMPPGPAPLWRELGETESDRGDWPAARAAFDEALRLDPDDARTLAARGLGAAMADHLRTARTDLDAALAIAPGDWLALAARGLLEIKSGQPETARQALLAASAIEPRYARAVAWLGVLDYQQGRVREAIAALHRAAELDPHDPLPWFWLAMIRQDRIDPAGGIAAAREAMSRLPFLASLDQVASDRAGTANLGSSFAQFGLEDWAMSYAQRAWLPLWGGSHFFLADRYRGEFNRNAELFQGYLADPTAFGAPSWRQDLIQAPGLHGAVSGWFQHDSRSDVYQPTVMVNGYANDAFPLAWLAEGMHTEVRARHGQDSASSATVALGARPTARLGLFAVGYQFRPEFHYDDGGWGEQTLGEYWRGDVGLSWRFTPDLVLWLKAGRRRENTGISAATGPRALAAGWPPYEENDRLEPEGDDRMLRLTWRIRDRHGLSMGYEEATARESWDESRRQPGWRQDFSQRVDDHSRQLWLAGHVEVHPHLRLEAGLARHHYDKDARADLRRQLDGRTPVANGGGRRLEDGRTGGSLGLVWTPADGLLLRTAWQDWQRPVSFGSLAPVATAGIPLDDELTLPGGHLRRVRLQLEWEAGDGFTQLALDQRHIDNITNPDGSPANRRQELLDLSRLRQRALASFGSLEGFVINPAFGSGSLRLASLSHSRVLSPRLSGFAAWRWADARNEGGIHRDRRLPWIPEHSVGLGLTWLPAQGLLVQAQAVWQDGAWRDEANRQSLPAGWSGMLRASWFSDDRHWQLDVYADGLFDATSPELLGGYLRYNF